MPPLSSFSNGIISFLSYKSVCTASGIISSSLLSEYLLSLIMFGKSVTAEIAGMCLFTVYQSLIKNGASSGRGSTTPPASLYSNEKVTVTSPLPSASSQPDRSSILPSLV